MTDRPTDREIEAVSRWMRAECDDLVARMMERGVVKPNADVTIEAGAQPRVWLAFTPSAEENVSYKGFRADCVTTAFAEARDYINSLPSRDERLRQNATEATAKAIEAVKAAGMEAEYVNPLELMMKRLSENAITKQED